jgi:hypothetical protein
MFDFVVEKFHCKQEKSFFSTRCIKNSCYYHFVSFKILKNNYFTCINNSSYDLDKKKNITAVIILAKKKYITAVIIITKLFISWVKILVVLRGFTLRVKKILFNIGESYI